MPMGKIQEDIYDRRVDGTGDWLVEHPDFVPWRESATSTLLWINGKSGSGKSHLAARVINRLNPRQGSESATALAYVYCSSTQSATPIKFHNILGSLLGQLYEQLSPLDDINPMGSRADSGSRESPQRAEMKEWINMACAKHRSCFIIIDGLDECSHFEDLCAFIAALTESIDSFLSVKVLVFSRPNYAVIDRPRSSFPQIQVDRGGNDQDIKAYISH